MGHWEANLVAKESVMIEHRDTPARSDGPPRIHPDPFRQKARERRHGEQAAAAKNAEDEGRAPAGE